MDLVATARQVAGYFALGKKRATNEIMLTMNQPYRVLNPACQMVFDPSAPTPLQNACVLMTFLGVYQPLTVESEGMGYSFIDDGHERTVKCDKFRQLVHKESEKLISHDGVYDLPISIMSYMQACTVGLSGIPFCSILKYQELFADLTPEIQNEWFVYNQRFCVKYQQMVSINPHIQNVNKLLEKFFYLSKDKVMALIDLPHTYKSFLSMHAAKRYLVIMGIFEKSLPMPNHNRRVVTALKEALAAMQMRQMQNARKLYEDTEDDSSEIEDLLSQIQLGPCVSDDYHPEVSFSLRKKGPTLSSENGSNASFSSFDSSDIRTELAQNGAHLATTPSNASIRLMPLAAGNGGNAASTPQHYAAAYAAQAGLPPMAGSMETEPSGQGTADESAMFEQESP